MQDAFDSSAQPPNPSGFDICSQTRVLQERIGEALFLRGLRATVELDQSPAGHAMIFIAVQQPRFPRRFNVLVGPHDQDGEPVLWFAPPQTIPLRICFGEDGTAMDFDWSILRGAHVAARAIVSFIKNRLGDPHQDFTSAPPSA